MLNSKKLFKYNSQRIIPLIVTLIYFFVITYISFFHHPYWFNDDGVLYFWWGDQILNGNGANVEIFNSSPGGSVVHAGLNYLIQDDNFFVLLTNLT